MSFLIENRILKKYINDDNVTDVIIPNGVIAIGDKAFQDADNIVSVTVPEGVTHIGEDAFSKCSQITSLTLPYSLKVIDDMAFASCKELADFSIPPNVREIGRYAFVECKRLSKITIPDTLSAIEEGMFASCRGLTEIIIPNSVKRVQNSAFNSCTGLSEVVLPQSVIKIDPFAFSGCINLRKVTISNIDTQIMFNAFFQCENVVTNLPIKAWDNIWGIEKMDYALHYMRGFKAGDPFYEDTKDENKIYIRHQLFNILKKENPDSVLNNSFSRKEPFGIRPGDTNVAVFLTDEIPLRIEEVEILLDKMQGNPEASAILLDYRKRIFSEEFLEEYENDKLQKELGLKERTASEWKKIFRLGNDGNGGYIILGYKGKDLNVEIPEKIGQKPVTAIDDFAFSPGALYLSREIRRTRFCLETVIIPDSVTAIGLKAFSSCAKLDAIVYRGKTFSADDFVDYCCKNVPEPIVSSDN